MEIKAVTVTLYTAGLAILASYLLSGMLVMPLKKLIDVMKKVADKELNTEIPIHRLDEYGQVGQAFNKMTHNLREAEISRKRLVEDIAHELRTPLSIVLTKLELIQQSTSSVQPETLLPLHDEILRVKHLVEELQLLTMAEAGELKLQLEWTDLAKDLADLTELVRPEAEANGIQFRGPDTDVTVQAFVDERRIKQVYLNLVSNALRHTPSGGEIIVNVYETDDSAYTVIQVKDTGPGIPNDAIPFLFDRFYRTDHTDRKTYGGAGLGLAITREMVFAHGGRMEVKNDGGAVFTVFLPLLYKDEIIGRPSD